MKYSKLVRFLANTLKKKFPLKYAKTYKKQKYSAEEVIDNLLYMTQVGCSFKKAPKRMSTSNLHKHSQFLNQNNFFKNTYVCLLSKYLNINQKEKLKHQSIDSTFIANKNGLRKNLARNGFNKNKYCLKVSFIVDSKGIPLSVLIKKGNIHDSQFFEDHLKNMLIDPKFSKIKKNPLSRPFLLADTAYDSKNLRKTCTLNGYVPIIPFNSRNSKNPKKTKKLTKEEKIIYKKRIIVENSICWFKKKERVNVMKERSIEAYESFLFLSLLETIYRRIFE